PFGPRGRRAPRWPGRRRTPRQIGRAGPAAPGRAPRPRKPRSCVLLRHGRRHGGGLELRRLRRALEGARAVGAAADGLVDLVEVAGADLALVARRGVAVLLEAELALLQLDVGGHAAAGVAVRQLEHRLV